MSSTKNNLLSYEEVDKIAILTLNRPNQQNALSSELMTALLNKLHEIKNNKDIKVVALFANGKNFCAGHDLKELKVDKSEKRFKQIFELCSSLMLEILKLPKPVIAGVQGIATAAGCQLVATCDLAIASESSKFATPGVNIGLFCSTPMVAVSRNIHRKQTMEMLLMGDFISPSKAKDIGLINNVVKDNDLKDETIKIAKMIATKSTTTVAIGKEAFYKQLEMGIEDAYKYTSKVMSSNMLNKDAQEGISAFIENRDPIWSDK
ncbi:MAG: enoyl-CoA hydratase [Pelagibacterales bacterium]|nr:enoyl-CoA hydratase [Pelagibacterales bacterium]PPR15779.1 MAG: putative enoyl-CoA hydratase echA8 [Alphaproteobacteria bacterium MarineAlpha9_Bin3]|tara:strand:+ start:13495 stop:14283 length:789 start_codon:yes stop_codon:yes gene_type:complete